jgi:Domain of unknown function (DUF5060)
MTIWMPSLVGIFGSAPAPPLGPAITVYASDTFTAVADQNLEAHTPDIGTSWTKVRTAGTASSLQVVAASDRLRSIDTSAGNNGVAYTVAPAPGSADYEVSVRLASLTNVSAEAAVILIARHQGTTSTADHYLCALWPLYVSGGVKGWLEILKRVGSTYTSLGSLSTTTEPNFAAGDVLSFRVQGTSLKALKNGVELLSATDAAVTLVGLAGLGFGAGIDSSSSADLDPDFLIDDYNVTSPSMIELFGVYEFLRINGNAYSNKFDYTVVELSAVFTGPGGVTKTVKGFHDGGTVWKCRFMPHLAGDWTFTASWTGSGSHPAAPTGGGFSCVDGGLYRGPLSVATDRSWFFKDARGAPFHWRGYGSHHILWYTSSVDIRTEAALLISRYQANMVDRDYNVTMWAGMGSNTHAGDPSGLNPETNWASGWWGNSPSEPSLDLYEPAVFAAYERVLGFLRDNNVYMLPFKMLYDQISEVTATRAQKLARYILARLGAYFNWFGFSVTWEWFDIHSTAEMNTLMEFIRSSDPYARLLSAHDLNHSGFTSWIDFSMTQAPNGGTQSISITGGNGRQTGQEQLADGSGAGGVANDMVEQPIVGAEWHWLTTTGYQASFPTWTHPTTASHMMRGVWGQLMAGVMPMPDWWNGWRHGAGTPSGNTTPLNFDLGEDRIRAMYDFVYGQTNYRQHVQLNGLVTGPGNEVCSGVADQEYLVYGDAGGTIVINLAAATGTFNVTWLNPATGATQSGGTVSGGASRNLVSPYGSADSVALVKK